VYMAISIDGLITRGNSDSNWVSDTDWDQFHSFIKSSDCIIMGRKTMEEFGNDFPIKGPFNIVLSNNEGLQKNDDNVSIISGTPEQVIKLAKSKNLKSLLLIGGSDVNSQFIKANLVDEIVLSIHPLVIGNGLSIFGEAALDVKLELIETKNIKNELVQIRYKVVK